MNSGEHTARAAIGRVLDACGAAYIATEPRSDAEWRLILGAVIQRAEAGLAAMGRMDDDGAQPTEYGPHRYVPPRRFCVCSDCEEHRSRENDERGAEGGEYA